MTDTPRDRGATGAKPALASWLLPPLGLLLLLSLLMIGPIPGRTVIIPERPDFFQQWYPYRLFLAAAWQSGEFPLWCHNLWCGFPLGADPLAGAFYPLNLIFAFLDYSPASTAFHLLHLWLAAGLMLALLREWNCSKLIAWLAALGYALSSPVFQRLDATDYFTAAAWLPGILWLMLSLLRRPRPRALLGLAVLAGLQVLAGDPELVFCSWLILLGFMLGKEKPGPGRAWTVVLALGLGLLLAAPQILLTLGGLPHSYLHSRPLSLPGRLWPVWLLLALVSAPGLETWRPKPEPQRRFRRPVVTALLIALLLLEGLALAGPGRARPDASLLARPTQYPGLDNPEETERLQLVSSRPQDEYLARMIRLERGPGLLGGYLGNGLRRVNEVVAPMAGPQDNWMAPALLADQNRSRLNFLGVQWIIAHGILPPGADAFSLDNPFLSSSYTLDEKPLGPRPPLVNSRYELKPGSRWQVSADLASGDIISLQVAAAAGPQPFGEGPVIKVSQAGASASNPETAEPHNQGGGLIWYSLPVWNSGAHLIALEVPANSPTCSLIFAPRLNNTSRPFLLVADDHLQIYQNRESQPRYTFYTGAEEMEDAESLSRLLRPGAFNPARQFFLAPDPAALSLPVPTAARPSLPAPNVLHSSFNRVQVAISTSLPGYLSTGESYYPGWRAWSDGTEVKIRRANYAFQAVPVAEPGSHQLTLEFDPREFRIGLWAGLSTLFSLAGFALVSRRSAKG